MKADRYWSRGVPGRASEGGVPEAGPTSPAVADVVPLLSPVPPCGRRVTPPTVSLGSWYLQADFPHESEKTLPQLQPDAHKETEAQRGADRPEVTAGLTAPRLCPHAPQGPPSLETLTMNRRCHVPVSHGPHSLGYLRGKRESERYLVSRIKNFWLFPQLPPLPLAWPQVPFQPAHLWGRGGGSHGGPGCDGMSGW